MKRIKVTGVTARRIDPEKVSEALGAEEAITMDTLRAAVEAEMVSTGGRPIVAGAQRRWKISMSNRHWTKLGDVADKLSTSPYSPSPGQVAGIILKLVLDRL
jgi:hypothetical protein